MLKCVLSATVLLVAASPAAAQVYVGAHGGLSSPETVNVQTERNRLTAEIDDGYRLGGAIGYDFGDFRLEAEGSYARATAALITDGTRRGITTSRPHRRYAGMLNGYVTPKLNDHVKLVLGAGGGLSTNYVRAALGEPCSEVIAIRYTVRPQTDRTGPAGRCVDQGKSGNRAFTAQGIAGLDFRFRRDSRWSVGPQFRYVRSFDVTASAKSTPTGETRFETKRDPATWEALVALTWRAGTPRK